MSRKKRQDGKLLVVAAPSGAGKTTLVRLLVERNPELRFSISYTTRQKRHNEKDGRDYFFVTVTDFHELEKNGELLESAVVFDNHYGTSRQQVQENLERGHNVILEIDWQGARQVRRALPQCITVFILPPSRAELERRLRNRRTDSDAVIERRLRDALADMSHWDEFEFCVINDDLEHSVTQLEDILAGRGRECRCGKMRERILNILV